MNWHQWAVERDEAAKRRKVEWWSMIVKVVGHYCTVVAYCWIIGASIHTFIHNPKSFSVSDWTLFVLMLFILVRFAASTVLQNSKET